MLVFFFIIHGLLFGLFRVYTGNISFNLLQQLSIISFGFIYPSLCCKKLFF